MHLHMRSFCQGTLAGAIISFIMLVNLSFASDIQRNQQAAESALSQQNSNNASAIEIAVPWTRATPPRAKVAGGYMTIKNNGKSDDRLLGGSVDFADAVEVHEMSMDGDVMRMRPLAEGLVVPAGQTITLEPGGFHLMFIGLNQRLVKGDEVVVTLTFEKIGHLELNFPVGPLGAKSMHAPDHN